MPILFTVFLFLLISPICTADNETVRLIAEKVKFNYTNKVLIATGHVQVEDDDLQLLAEEIRVDVGENILIIYRLARIIIGQEEKNLYIEPLYYDLFHKKVWFESLSENNNKIKQIIYEDVNLSNNIKRKLVIIGDILLTTCDEENSHYSFHAATLEYFPDGSFILKHINYLESGQNLFYLPYLALKPQAGEPFFTYPHFGYNLAEGFFLKQTYDFFLDRAQWGRIFLDFTEKRGMGKGLYYTWDEKENGKIWSFIYHSDNLSLLGNYSAEVGMKLPISTLSSCLQTRVTLTDEAGNEGGRNQNLGIICELLPLTGWSYGNLNYFYNITPYCLTTNLDLNISRRWTNNSQSLSLQGNYHRDTNSNYPSPFLWNESYFCQFIYELPVPILTFFLRKEHGPNFFREYFPEFHLEWPLQIKELGQLNLNLVYLQKRLNQTNGSYPPFLGHRLALNLDMTPISIAQHGPFDLKTATGILTRVYDKEGGFGGVRPMVSLQTALSPSTECLVNFSYLKTFGAPPALFWEDDWLISAPNVNFKIANQNDKHQINLITDYFWNPEGHSYSFDFSYNNIVGDYFNLKIYSPNNIIGPIETNLNFTLRNAFSLYIKGSCDPKMTQWNQLILGISLQCLLINNLFLNLTASYDFYQHIWQQGGINLNYYWHCRRLCLNYNWINQEFSLLAVIN